MPDVGCVVEKTRPGARVCAGPISMRKRTDLDAGGGEDGSQVAGSSVSSVASGRQARRTGV